LMSLSMTTAPTAKPARLSVSKPLEADLQACLLSGFSFVLSL
jgi:hypothetical protein